MDIQSTTFDLIERFRAGDRDAFTLLFEKYQRRLAVLIHYKLRPEKRRAEDVEEILQDTFCAAFEDLHYFQYRSPGSFLNWLSRIADHVIVDAARRQNRQKRRAELTRFRSDSHPQGPEPIDSRSPSRILAEREELSALLDKFDELPEQYRHVIVMAKIEGLSTAEMAARLGQSRAAVALLLHRAVQRFRAIHKNE
jgi:RNA polymerase sigma-70 factor (ECF subfamily)